MKTTDTISPAVLREVELVTKQKTNGLNESETKELLALFCAPTTTLTDAELKLLGGEYEQEMRLMKPRKPNYHE